MHRGLLGTIVRGEPFAVDSVSVEPTDAEGADGTTQQFTETVESIAESTGLFSPIIVGVANLFKPLSRKRAVTWSVESGGGSIDANGLYTFGATDGVIRATSVDDPDEYGEVTATAALPPYATSITLANAHSAFAGAIRINSNVDVIYRGGTTHAFDKGSIYRVRSTNGGRSWGAEETLYTDATFDSRDSSVLSQCANGDVISAFFRYNHTGGTLSGVPALTPKDAGIMRSVDGGATFGAPTFFDQTALGDGTAAWAVLFGRPMVVGSNLYFTGYSSDGASDRVNFYKSTDHGATFTLQGSVSKTGSGTAYGGGNEAAFWTDGTTVRMIFREDTTAASPKLWRTTSADEGATWSTPEPFHGGICPMMLPLASGDLMLAFSWRLSTSLYAVLACFSADDGVTWTWPRRLVAGLAEGPFYDYGYPCPVQLADGSVLIPYYDQFYPSTLRFHHLTAAEATADDAAAYEETFTGANGTALATHDATWSVPVGAFEIQSNALIATAATGVNRAIRDFDTPNAKIKVEMAVPNTNNYHGAILFRYVSGTEHLYLAIQRDSGGTPYVAVGKFNGTESTLKSTNCSPSPTNQTVVLEIQFEDDHLFTYSLRSPDGATTYMSSFYQGDTFAAEAEIAGIYCYKSGTYSACTINDFRRVE